MCIWMILLGMLILNDGLVIFVNWLFCMLVLLSNMILLMVVVVLICIFNGVDFFIFFVRFFIIMVNWYELLV